MEETSVKKEISENYIDIKSLMASKGIKVTPIIVRFLNRLLHVKELNKAFYEYRHLDGLDCATAYLQYIGVNVDVISSDNIPTDGKPFVVGNHPLGGPDGLALLEAVGRYRKDIRFPVNDFLMYVPGLSSLFIPIDKVHRNNKNVAGLESAFASDNAILYFPAGLCSRRTKGVIKDPEWKPTFIKKAQQYQRDVMPVFFDAKNRNRFYNIANLRKKIGIKFNFEMALLPSEMFAQKGKTFRLIVGKPIPYTTFDNRHSAKEWAEIVKEYVYSLKDNPQAQFPY